MFAVFDGHNGARTAKLCARLLPNIINTYMKEGRRPDQALHDGFLKYMISFGCPENFILIDMQVR